MDGDVGDGVVVSELAGVSVPDYHHDQGRGPSWISDAFLADAEQVVAEYSGSDGFYLAGVSMGGTQALALAALLPPLLRARIVGVLCLIPGSNLPQIVERTTVPRVRESLLMAMGGMIEAGENVAPRASDQQSGESAVHVLLQRGRSGAPERRAQERSAGSSLGHPVSGIAGLITFSPSQTSIFAFFLSNSVRIILGGCQRH